MSKMTPQHHLIRLIICSRPWSRAAKGARSLGGDRHRQAEGCQGVQGEPCLFNWQSIQTHPPAPRRFFELVFTPNPHPWLPWIYQTISVTLVVIQSLSTYTAAALELSRKQTGGLSPLSSVLSTLAARGHIMSKLPPTGLNNVLSNRSRHIARLPFTAPLRQTNEDTAHPPTASAIRP